ncbi:MAG: hypothetical protein ACKO96_43225 [Flammeovirgaceae bacterium]
MGTVKIIETKSHSGLDSVPPAEYVSENEEPRTESVIQHEVPREESVTQHEELTEVKQTIELPMVFCILLTLLFIAYLSRKTKLFS